MWNNLPMTQIALLLLLTLQASSGRIHTRSNSGGNLVPNWQFDEGARSWKAHSHRSSELDAEIVPWTDGRPVRALKCIEQNNNTECYSCWAISDLIKINPSLAYEFSIYIKSNGRDLHNFFGFYVYNINRTRAGMDFGWNDPYFKRSKNDGYFWKRWNGYILPSYIPDHDEDGVVERNHTSNKKDWIWPTEAHYVRVRFGSCYGDGVEQNKTWFVFPSVKEVTPELSMLAEQLNHHSSGLTTFDFDNPRDWIKGPAIGGTAFVNGQYTTVHRSVQKGRGCYSPAVSRKFPIEHTKQYEFSVWIRSTGAELINYLGFFVYNQYGQIKSGSLENPYFRKTKSDKGSWVRWFGFILPSNVTSSPSDPNKADVPWSFSKGVNWKWPTNATKAVIRFQACSDCGDDDGKGVSYFALPQVFQSDLQLYP